MFDQWNSLTQDVGAVASMYNIKNAISVARKVLEHSKHTLLVGQAATEFALKFNFKYESLETVNSNRQHDDWLKNNCQPNFWRMMSPDPTNSCGPYKPINLNPSFSDDHQLNETLEKDIRNHDTIGMIAIDLNGHLAAGTSTNGAIHKIPG